MMRDLDQEGWESLASDQAQDLVEEILDVVAFGVTRDEDKEEVLRLLVELQSMGEKEAAQALKKKFL